RSLPRLPEPKWPAPRETWVHASSPEGWSLEPRRLPQALDRPDDQRVRLAGLAARDPVGRARDPERERLRGRGAGNRGVPAVRALHAPGGCLGRPRAPPLGPRRGGPGARRAP